MQQSFQVSTRYRYVVFTRTIFFGFNSVRTKLFSKAVNAANLHKMLTFVVLFTYFCTRPNKGREEQNVCFVVVVVFFWGGGWWGQLLNNVLGNLEHLVESPKIITVSWISTIHKKRYVAFSKQNTYILASFDLNSVLRRQTSEKGASKPSFMKFQNNAS